MFPTIYSEHCSPSGSPTDRGSSVCKDPERGRALLAAAPIVSEVGQAFQRDRARVRLDRLTYEWVCVCDSSATAGHPPGTRDNHDKYDGRSSRQPELGR